jgi:hypothetical protein
MTYYLATTTILQAWVNAAQVVGIHVHRTSEPLHHSSTVHVCGVLFLEYLCQQQQHTHRSVDVCAPR